MMRTLLLHLEKGLLIAAGLTVVGVGLVWTSRTRADLERIELESAQVALMGSAVIVPPDTGAPEHRVWTRPPVPAGGGGWVGELFTPPVVFSHPATRSFAVASPHESAAPADGPSGWELLAVRRVPYRLQLAGYFGEPGDYLAAFVGDALSPVWLARPGQGSDELGITLRSFDVRRVPVGGEAAPEVFDFAGVATVHDARLGAEVVLDTRSLRLTDAPVAVFQRSGPNRSTLELAEGDTFTDEAISYRIERIHWEPPEVVIARTSRDLTAPERRVLRPSESKAGRVDRPTVDLEADPASLRGIAHHP